MKILLVKRGLPWHSPGNRMETSWIQDPVLSVKQAAEYLGVTTRTIRSYLVLKDRPLPHSKPCGKILIHMEDLKEWTRKK